MTESVRSAYQTPITIKEVVEKIHSKKYLLPAIQRTFVWNPRQIIRLFDSLMRKYTIGSFLFWRVEKERVSDFQFYEFIREYHERDNKHNPKANVLGEEGVTSILDGQQRLTSFYIGLKGTYAYKLPRKRWDNDRAFPKRKLHINLLAESDDFDLKYDFQFLTDRQATRQDSETYWFDVGKILEFEGLRDIHKFYVNSGLAQKENERSIFASDALFGLFEAIQTDSVINYYLETSQELDKVLNIFIRVNSGGTQLSYSDLLLSIATAQWKTKDARDEITRFVDELNGIGDGFDFNKDFVLKSCLILSGIRDIAFKVDNFTKANMSIIEKKWEGIQEALHMAVELVSTFGYDYNTLTSANAIIPIAYYILQKGNPRKFSLSSAYLEDRRYLSKWLRTALLKRSFSGQPDNVLRPIRRIIGENPDTFPINEIVERFRGTAKSFIFSDDDIDNLLFSQYGKGHTFSVLAMLYPSLNFRDRFHIDHIFPRSFFRKRNLRKKGIPESKWEFYMDHCNFLSNLQLMEGIRNEEKSNTGFEDWLNEEYTDEMERKEYMKKNFIPTNIDLSFDNLEEFFIKRGRILVKELRDKLM